ncbi:unnamed protein product [Caenorhabditis nigoni]
MKLHRMPLLVKRIIIEELGFDERLFLSFTSKRTCSLLGLFRTDFKGISITIRIDSSEISVRVKKPPLTEPITALNARYFWITEWIFDMPFHQHHMRDSSTYTIDGSTVSVEKVHSFGRRVGLDTTNNAITLFGKFLRHLNSFLNIEKCFQCEFDNAIPVVDILSEIDGLRATVIEGLIHQYPQTCQRIFVVVWSEENLRTMGRDND